MVKYAIGLDIGITSVGWATVLLDDNDCPCGILDIGSRIFDAAEHPKTGASLAAPRREARSSRRRLRRHRHRLERIRNLIISQNLLTETELATLFDGQLEDIYKLRTKALDFAVTKAEFARILIHLAQRRGFKSGRNADTISDDGKLLQAVNDNKQRMLKNGYRTVGEMFLKDSSFSAQKRNKGGNYISTVAREQTENEARLIFDAQRKLGNDFASPEFEEKYMEILLSQRSFDEGPGGNSIYGGTQIGNMIGKCTFFPEEKRAAKASYSFEYFSLLEKVNHIKIISDGVSVPLDDKQREVVIALAHESDSITYARLRKALNISADSTFNSVYYGENDIETAEKKAKFVHMQAYHKIRRALDKIKKGYIASLSREKLNEIGRVLSIYKSDANIETALVEFGFTKEEIEAINTIGSFSKFGHISVKACDLVIPYLEQGMTYDKACAAASLNFKVHGGEEKYMLLHPTEDDFADITSPVVKRAVSQTIKVVNAIIRKYGCSPTFLNIELAREMSKDFSERNKIKKDNENNRAQNERILERIRKEFGHKNPTGLDLVKLKLFEEQGGVCAYSLEQMSIEHLFDPNYAEIDHIVPYSISFDDSYKNKVLVLARENRNKGNRLPLEYLTGEKRDRFIVWTSNNVRDSRKRNLLLKEEITPEDKNRFIERNIQDTKTMSRFLLNYFKDYLAFSPSPNRKKHVTAVNGIITSYMRKRLGITKIRENGDLHHAVDALTVVCTTDAMIQQITRYATYRECEYMQTDDGALAVSKTDGEILRKFPYPWPMFRKELEARLSDNPAQIISDLKLPLYETGILPTPKPVFVSRMPKRKITGAAHKDTVKSPRVLESGQVIVKRPLTDLTFKLLEENYYNKESDMLLYTALIDRLKKFNGDAKKAFSDEFRKPKSDGTPGPVVKKVKLLEKTTLNVAVHGGKGVADNDSMIRIDIFYVENDGYYLVPIYISDALSEKLPNKACVQGKPYSEWKVMDDKNFVFSLYPNDLIKVTHRKSLSFAKAQKESTLPEKYEAKSELVYYTGTDISTGAIIAETHDSSYLLKKLGIKTLEKLEKYTVDVLGNYTKINREKRVPFDMKRG